VGRSLEAFLVLKMNIDVDAVPAAMVQAEGPMMAVLDQEVLAEEKTEAKKAAAK
jgi:broad specificity phosphatase PhoE